MDHSSADNVSCFLYGPGDARYEQHVTPSLDDPYDVLVRIHYVGVCGSDVHFWREGGISQKVSSEHPLVMGHEASGVIDKVGTSVSNLKVGDRVAIEPGVPCRRCNAFCKRGNYNLCGGMQFAADPPGNHGALTKLFKAPEDFCYRLPDQTSLEEGVLVEPLAVAVHAVKMSPVKCGDTVVILGSGTIGLLCAAVARSFGAEKVIVADILERKLEFAQQWNQLETFRPDPCQSPEKNAASLIQQHKLDLGVDIILETSGATSSVCLAIHGLRAGGSFVQVGMVGKTVDFPIQTVCDQELHVHGSFRYGPGDFETALSLLASKKVDVKPLITSTLPFDKATEAWEKTKNGEGIKNLIRGPGF